MAGQTVDVTETPLWALELSVMEPTVRSEEPLRLSPVGWRCFGDVFIRVARECGYVRPELSDVTEPSKDLMQWLVLGTTYFLLVLFIIGVFDLLLGLYDLLVSGNFTKPVEVIALLDTVLVLLIIVEVHRTLLAYVRDEPVIQIVVGAAIVAIAREIISFRVEDFETGQSTLAAAGALGVLLVTLIIAYFLVCRIEPTATELN